MTLLERLIAARAAVQTNINQLLDDVDAEERDALSDDERQRFDELRAERDDLDGRIAELEAEAERRRNLDRLNERLDGGSDETRQTGGVVRVGDEPRTYNPDEARRGVSFVRDVIMRHDDPAAAERLTRHAAEARADGVERRDVATSAFAGLVVPQYLTDLVAPLARAMAPTLGLCQRHPLPPSGMTVNVSRITTGTGVAAQASENGAVQETDIDDTLLTVNVRTYAGQQDVSRQAIERGTNVDEIVVRDLAAAYFTAVDSAILNADGTSGTHLGIRNTGSIVSVTYTDVDPTAAELWPKLFDLIQQVQSGVYVGLSHFIMAPRRWAWLASQVGTSFPFLTQTATPAQTGGVIDTNAYGGVVGRIAGVPVILDANIPTNLSTNQDVIVGVTADELHYWGEATEPMFLRADQVGAGSLSVKLVAYGYGAFTAGRYPGAHGVISGTGLATPSF